MQVARRHSEATPQQAVAGFDRTQVYMQEVPIEAGGAEQAVALLAGSDASAGYLVQVPWEWTAQKMLPLAAAEVSPESILE
jgi:predicted phage gp36 major capsid-like protein